MKTTEWFGGKAPYETPETELIETVLETGLLVLTNGEANNTSAEDFEEEDYSGSIIWK